MKKIKTGKTGVWIIGAFGSVSTCLITGYFGLLRGKFPPAGLLSEREEFSGLHLLPLENFVFGGWDIRDSNLYKSAREYRETSGVFDAEFLEEIREDLYDVSRRVKPGTAIGCGRAINQQCDREPLEDRLSVAEIVGAAQEDLQRFQADNHLDTVIVVNLASTEPQDAQPDFYRSLPLFRKAIETNIAPGLHASVLYAYAALDAGFPYVNFTPSPGSSIDALMELALERGLPHMGRDGKTGETLIKTALAPMFAIRNLPVLSWAGFNVLGNRDGQVLNHPKNKSAKVQSKNNVLDSILSPTGQTPHAHTSIEYVPSLGDWKTAWDLIHFSGWMNTKMTMQFTWQGCDSVLAAPLVLDLARFTRLAWDFGEKGLMPQLALYFKSPTGCETQDLHKQYQELLDYAKTRYEKRASMNAPVKEQEDRPDSITENSHLNS